MKNKEEEIKALENLPEDCVFLGWGGEFPVPQGMEFQGIAWSGGNWGVLGKYAGICGDLMYACTKDEYTNITGRLLNEVYQDEEIKITMTEEEFKKSIDNAQDAICQQLSYVIKNTVGWGYIRDQNHLYEKLLKMGVKP